jgi:hypothetical protein
MRDRQALRQRCDVPLASKATTLLMHAIIFIYHRPNIRLFLGFLSGLRHLRARRGDVRATDRQRAVVTSTRTVACSG